MHCVRLLYLLALVAQSCVAFIPPDSYPIMKLEELTGEEQAKALELLDATLAKLANNSAIASNYKVVNISMVWIQLVSAKKMSYQLELTENNASKLCNARIWHQTWLSSGGIDFQLQCENEDSKIEIVF